MTDSLKDRVLEAVDIVDVIGGFVALKRKGREFAGLCPFHNDHSPSMLVSPAKQIFKCFSCGAGGDVISFVQMHRRIEFREALIFLAERAGIDTGPASPDGYGNPHAKLRREEIRRVLTWAAGHFARNLASPAGASARNYARQRGLSDETIERFGLGLAPQRWDDLLGAARKAGLPHELLQQAGLITTNESGRVYDRFRNRLIFPIRDPHARCVAFGGRTLGDDPAKYLNSPESPLFSKGRILYALDQARPAIERTREALVVEGYMDAVLLHQYGIHHAVATLGTALTDAHLKLLAHLADRLVLAFDSDEAGVHAADRAVQIALRHRIDVRILLLEAGEDPADCVIRLGANGFKSLLQSTIAALEFKWNLTRAAFVGQGERGRQDAIEGFLAFIAGAQAPGGMAPLEVSSLVGKLADLLRLPAGVIYEWLSRQRGRSSRVPAAAFGGISQASPYDHSIAGLPRGLVAAVEESFGVAIRTPGSFQLLQSGLLAGGMRCPVWGRVHDALRSLIQAGQPVSEPAILGRCGGDAVVADMLVRAARRAPTEPVSAELCADLCRRVASELESLRLANLHGQVCRGEDGARQNAFESLVAVARRQHSLLGTAQSGGLR